MARQRLTTRRLTAAPDAFSGRNFNSPVMLYDTHPNQMFKVGEDVIPLNSSKTTPIRGVVLGHCAEDRIWVQWPTEIVQEDVSDMLPLRSYEYGTQGQVRLKGPAASRSAARRASPQEDGDVQELVFDTLPADQVPEEEIDLEPEDSGEVTLIDLGSVCEDEYDQTGVLEQVIQDSDLESGGGLGPF